MKRFILLTVIFFIVSCVNKPRMLVAKVEPYQSNLCIKLTNKTKEKQSIYQIGGWRENIHNYDKNYYYYFLPDFINVNCSARDLMINIDDAKVGIIFQTAGKGRSYLQLIFNVEVSFYERGDLKKSQLFQAQSKTKKMSFIVSKKEQAILVSKALYSGYQDILKQIAAIND